MLWLYIARKLFLTFLEATIYWPIVELQHFLNDKLFIFLITSYISLNTLTFVAFLWLFEILKIHFKTLCLCDKLALGEADFFSRHAISETAILYGHLLKRKYRQCYRATWPILIHRVHWAHSSWLAQSQVIHSVQSWGFGGLLLLRWNEKQECCFLLSPFSHSLYTSIGCVLHLWGGLGRQDGGCIMSWGGFTVRFATSSLSLCLSPLNVPLHSKAAKSLLTWKLWTHRELIRVSARLAICMWIGCGCIPGLFMSFTPQCLGLLSSQTSHCHRYMLGRNPYTAIKSAIVIARITQKSDFNFLGNSRKFKFFKAFKCAFYVVRS